MRLSHATRSAFKQCVAAHVFDPIEIRRLARDAGLSPEHLRPELSAIDLWDAVVDLLERQTLEVRLEFLEELKRVAPVLAADPVLAQAEAEWRAEEAPSTKGSSPRARVGEAPAGPKLPSLKPAQPFKVFIVYARKDKTYLDELLKQLSSLRSSGWIDDWTDQALDPGERWKPALLKALAEAQLVLLLDSPDFAASDFIQNVELPKALEREKAGTLTLVRLRVRSILRTDEDPLQQLQYLPRDNRTLAGETDSGKRDTLWTEVVNELYSLLKKRVHQQTPLHKPSEAQTLTRPFTQAEALNHPEISLPRPPLSPTTPIWVGATLLLLALGVWAGVQGGSDDPLPAASPPELATQAVPVVEAVTPPRWSPVPLSLIWLEDPENPDLRLNLEKKPVARRTHLLKLVTLLLERGVKGIAMDLDFSADYPEGRDSVERLLVRAHAQVPRVPVMVVGGNNPLLPECPVQGQGSACFDLLADAHVQFPLPLEGQPFTRLDACITGRVSLSAGLAAWIDLFERKLPLPMESVCVGDRSVTPSAAPKPLLKRAQVRELDSGSVLRGVAPAAFVLVGLKREGDRHTVQFSGSSDVEEEGPRILASGTVSFLREAPMPSSRGDHP